VRDLLVPELRVTSVLLWFIWSVYIIHFTVLNTAKFICM